MKLEAIATDIGKLGMVSAYVTVMVLFIRFWIEQGIAGYDWGNNYFKYISSWFRHLITGVTIIVVAVPEGLPLAVMISLAYSVRKMLKDKNFVKRLASCEIMGGANNICSDKTGTLTMNKMHVTNIWHGISTELPAAPHKPIGQTQEKTKKKNKKDEPAEAPRDQELPEFDVNADGFFKSANHSKVLLESLACNTPMLDTAGATDKAMIEMIPRCLVEGKKQDVEEIRSRHLDSSRVIRFEFTSKRKKMSTVVNNVDDNEFGYDKRIHVKGASEIVLATCTHWINEEGNREPISDEIRTQIDQSILNYAEKALRTICVAYKDLREGEGGPEHDHMLDKDFAEIEQTDLTCIAILGIKDIIRPEVPSAVEQCRKAGVRVRMVTGDNKVTAKAIAKECALIDDNMESGEYTVMEGKDFFDKVGGLTCDNCKNDCPCECKPDKIDEKVKDKEVFAKVRQELCVLARSRPEDKYLMVTGLREWGDVVAVTGDGTNDAPALKKADVGFAMGITGTDVAKGAADIILLDDNFASIVQACMWGRNIYDNIRKFLQF